MSNQVPIPPTGRITITLDWVADLNVPPRCGATIVAAAWSAPEGIVVAASSFEGTVAEVTITTAGLRLGRTYTLVCSVTLSNGDVLPGGVDCVAALRKSVLSKEVCPVP